MLGHRQLRYPRKQGTNICGFGGIKIIGMIEQTRIIYLNYFHLYSMQSHPSLECQKHQTVNETSALQKSPKKKSSQMPSRRFLKNHDLDQLLVYQKRDPKKCRNFIEECAERHRNIQQAKKQRKKQKLQTKILENKQIYTEDKKKQQQHIQNGIELNQLVSHNSDCQEPEQFRKKKYSKDRINHRYNYSSSEENTQFKFPLVNTYYSQHSKQFIQTMGVLDSAREIRKKSINDTFINCDVKYFNWDLFVKEIGKFDILLIDPPWRIKGAQKNDSQFMFSNCKFSLQYNTMSNHQIRQLPLHEISDEGFIFLWILNTQLNSSLEIMQEWGYQLVEQLAWIKLRNQKIYLTHGYYFMHSYEVCLIGYKNTKKNPQSMHLRHGINPNVIFGQVCKKSQKPQDIYHVLEMVFKGKKKLEIFARNHNLRFGIFSMGNQLGEAYDKWMLHLHCDDCSKEIKLKTKRYKSKIKANYDICQECMNNHEKDEFFQFANQIDQDVRHEYLSCNLCGLQPIWGIRFQCLTCMDYDLCQNCFDRYLTLKTTENSTQKIHPTDHEFRTLEIPVFGSGFAIHEYKCSSCYQNPIIGICLSCTTCKNYKLCQKCFFQRSMYQRTNTSKIHCMSHEFEVMFQPQFNQNKKYQCFNCKKMILEGCWICQNCYNFFFCQQCYMEKDKFKSLYANTHKKYHVFSRMF